MECLGLVISRLVVVYSISVVQDVGGGSADLSDGRGGREPTLPLPLVPRTTTARRPTPTTATPHTSKTVDFIHALLVPQGFKTAKPRVRATKLRHCNPNRSTAVVVTIGRVVVAGVANSEGHRCCRTGVWWGWRGTNASISRGIQASTSVIIRGTK